MATGSGKIHVYYHTHWDREWYMPFRAYQVRLAEVVDEILDRLEKNELPCFMLDGQTVVLEDYLELRPENRARLQTLVKSGRLSIGPWFVMPDEFLVGGESLIRNLMRGIRESRAWGCDSFTGYLPDTFGHTADMPTILHHFGLNSTVIWRGVNPEKDFFRWQSPADRNVLAYHLTDGYFQMMLHDWTATEAEQQKALSGLAEKLQAVTPAEVPCLLPIGGDHLAPVTARGRALLLKQLPDIQETTPDRYLAGLNLNGQLPRLSGELVDNSGSFLLPGVYSSRLYLKQANRTLEHMLAHQLEPLLALGQTLLKDKPRYPLHELDLAWKTLMLNHPHDSICGCSVDEVHRENEVRFDQVRELGEAMHDRLMHPLLQASGSKKEWVICNTGDRPFTGVVPVWEDDAEPSGLMQVFEEASVLQNEYLFDPHRIPLAHLRKQRRQGAIWVDDVPPFGVRIFNKKQLPQAKFEPIRMTENSLENAVLRIEIGAAGEVTITDKTSDKTHANLITYKLLQDQGDSYNSAPVPESPPSTLEFSGCDIARRGPLVGVISLRFTIHHEEVSLDFDTRIELKSGSPFVEFTTHFINTLIGYKFQAVFSTSQPVKTVSAESHLSMVERHYDPNYRELDHMPVEKMKELKTNTGPVQRFFSANGQSWITKGLTEYEVYQDQLSITLLRGFSFLSKEDTGVRGAQAGPPLPTFEGECLDRLMVCQYAWMPTPSEAFLLYDMANRFYGCVFGESGRGEKSSTVSGQSLINWDNPALVSSACRWIPEKNALELRLINTTAEKQSAKIETGFPCARIEAVNFLHEDIQKIEGPTIAVEPFDTQTFLLYAD